MKSARAILFLSGIFFLAPMGLNQSAYADDSTNYESEVSSKNVQHLFDLAFKYDNGLGVPANRAKAAEYYRQAAEGGHVQSMFYLALLYRRGDGVQRDLTKACKWLRRAEERYSPAKLVREEIELALSTEEANKGQKKLIAWKQ